MSLTSENEHLREGQTIRKLIGEGAGGAGEVQKKVFAQGKIK